MVNQAKNIANLAIQVSPASLEDRLVFIYSPNTNIAQTATIPISGIYSNVQSDPANSVSSNTVSQGTLFFSNSYLYFATANGYLKRIALTDF